MNFVKNCLLGLCFLASTLAAHSQNDAKATETSTYLQALGGTGAVSSFNAQIALGRIAKADVSTLDKLKHAAGESGGIGSGMSASAKMLTNCLKHLPKKERAGLQSIIDLQKLIADEGSALVEVMKAKGQKGEGLAAAEKKFAEARAKAAKVLSKDMGFPAEFVK